MDPLVDTELSQETAPSGPKEVPPKTVNVFVYGSLMNGGRLNPVLHGSMYVGEYLTPSGFCLVDLGQFPGMLKWGEYKVLGEIWKVSPQRMITLDMIESEGYLYLRQLITFNQMSSGNEMEAFTYLIHPNVERDMGDLGIKKNLVTSPNIISITDEILVWKNK